MTCHIGIYTDLSVLNPNFLFYSGFSFFSRNRVCVRASQAQGATIKPKCHRLFDLNIIVTSSYLCTYCAFHINGQSGSFLKRIIPEPHVPSRGSQARGTRLTQKTMEMDFCAVFCDPVLPQHWARSKIPFLKKSRKFRQMYHIIHIDPTRNRVRSTA
jgi:hypothetical protein